MITTVKLDGVYKKGTDVPHIGQRKWMLVNGSRQLMTLNQIGARRRGIWEYSEQRKCDEFIIEFLTEEIWGDYY